MRLLPLPALVLVLALGVVACGGGDDRDRAPAPAAQSAQADGEPLSIPALYDELQSSVVAIMTRTAEGGGEGSGVVFEPRRIVTNNHVIAGAREVTVGLASGERLEATVLARDPRTDLAVLEVERDLPPAPFADRLPQVGATAIAIGSPLGFEGSVTAGIVSGLDRAIPSGGRTPALVNLLQTDAPISPGNSGGALVGADGKVIGINVAYIPPAARAVSIGFSIPAPTVRDVVAELLRDGEVDHAYLGTQLAPLGPRTAERLELDTRGGAIVRAVERDGPAARAGLRAGDILVGVGGEPIEQVEDVLGALRRQAPGTELAFEVLRDGERRTVDVRVGRRPA